MVTHMLVQIPLLAIAGVLLAPGGVKRTQTAMHRAGAGAPMLIVATTTSIYWMLPRALDSALASGTAEWAKFVTLPLLLGVPLALGWRAASSLTRAFVVANALPMFAAVGWLYRDAPVRVCNYYLVGQQQLAGSALIWVAVAAGAAFGVGAFRRVPERSPAAPHTSVPGIVPRAG